MYPRQNKDGSVGALCVEIKNESDMFARYVALVIRSPLKVRGRAVIYDEATIDNGDKNGSAQILLFSNHNSAPLFPRGMLTKNFKFQLGQLIKEPEKQLDHFRWTVFADSMPKQSGTFAVEEIYSQMT
jgi:hypothetical protein